MKTSCRRGASLLAFVFAFAAGPARAATYTINWYLGHPNLDFFEEAAANFKKAVETGSHGDIAVRIVTTDSDAASGGSGSIATAPEIAQKVEKGEIQMGHSFTDVMSGMEPRFMAFEAPYLLRNDRHMEAVLDGPVGAELLAGLQAHHMVGLSFTYSGGASGLATVDREIRRSEDLKGLKVGVYGDAVNAAWLESLGATPVTIGHDTQGILTKTHAGAMDATVITWRNFERARLNQGYKHFSLAGSTYLVSVTYINEKFFNSLPEAYRKLIKDESEKAGRIERAKTIELNEAAKREMLGKGVQPVYMSEEARSAFVRAVQPAYKSSIEGLVGKDLLEKIRKTPDSAEQPAVPATTAAL